MTTAVVGPKSPWLAISFGCCASNRRDNEILEDDEGRRALRAKGETEMQICYDQPQIEPQPRASPIHTRPTTSHSMSKHVSHWVANGRDFASRASSRASIHTITRPHRSHPKPRPSIGRPMDFRHYDGGFDGILGMGDDARMPIRRRRSFTPLELSIYMPEGRLSPLPDFATLEWDKLPTLEIPAQALVRDRDSRTISLSSDPLAPSYLIQRKPVSTTSRRSSVQSQTSLRSRPVSIALCNLPSVQEQGDMKSRPESFVSIPTSIGHASTHSSLTSPKRLLSRLPSPARTRANTAPSPRPGSLRRAKTDVDEAIRELNTIVEERRASAYRSNNMASTVINRPPPSPSHHVPAIAPSLRMHVRSETLSDIGSAFSVPAANKPLPCPPTSAPESYARGPAKLSLSPPARTFTGPLNSNPITPPTPTVPTPTTPVGRLGAWLKRSIPSTHSSQTFKSVPTTPKSSLSTPFYQCEPSLPSSSLQHSRPSTAGSGTRHARQDSNDTATVTLFSSTTADSAPTTPTLSTRSLSPEPIVSPETPARGNLLKGEGKMRRIPKPLDLAKEKEIAIEASLGSARSMASQRSLKPPPSPNYGLLRGMEITIAGEGMAAVSPVGVAF